MSKSTDAGVHPPIVLHVSYPPFDDLVARPGPLEVKAWDRLVAQGKLPATKLGRREYTRRSFLLALIDQELSTKRSTDESQSSDPRSALIDRIRGDE